MEGEAGCGDEGGFPVAGEAVDAGCLGGGQPDRGDAGRAGLAAGAAGRTSAPARAAWMAAVLSWARAVSTVCLQIAFQVRAWDWSQPRASFPVLKVVSTGQRRPAMVMK